jgi:hypothetical protein
MAGGRSSSLGENAKLAGVGASELPGFEFLFHLIQFAVIQSIAAREAKERVLIYSPCPRR